MALLSIRHPDYNLWRKSRVSYKPGLAVSNIHIPTALKTLHETVVCGGSPVYITALSESEKSQNRIPTCRHLLQISSLITERTRLLRALNNPLNLFAPWCRL
jgi:hypothetical protein